MTKKIKLLGASVYIGESGCAVMDDDESGRVAHLISAAPDLLEALQECMQKGKRWHPCDPVVLKAQAAISKALGN